MSPSTKASNAAEPKTPPQITWGCGVLKLCDPSTFGKGHDAACARFLEAILFFDSVSSVKVDRSCGTIEIRLADPRTDIESFIRTLAEVTRNSGTRLTSISLPRRSIEHSCMLYYNHGLISTCSVLTNREGLLRIKHEAIHDDRVGSDDLAAAINTIPGVTSTRIGMWSNVLTIRFDPARLAVPRLLRLIESVLDATTGWEESLPHPVKTRYAVLNGTVATAGLADFVLPMLGPVSAGLLIWFNLRTFKAAGLQLKHKKLGLPLLYCTIIAVTLISGQFLASALMFWTFKFWHGRLRRDIASQRRRLVAESLPRPELARMLIANDKEVLVSLDRLRPGDRFIVGPNETVPADGVILDGSGIVDDRSLQGGEAVSRKRKGDRLLACSTVLVGTLRVEVSQSINETRSSEIVKSLILATSPAPGPLSPTRRAEAFADRHVGPTLATAGLGLLVGDLATAGAILRPDYATGPGVTMPLETLRSVTLCARQGIVARDPEVFDRLVKIDEIVLIDSPELHRGELTTVTVHSPYVTEAEFLRYAASAFRHLADDRAAALMNACHERGVHVLNLKAIDYESGVTAIQGTHKIRVRERERSLGAVGPLELEVDSRPLGWVSFARSTKPSAGTLVSEIRRVAKSRVILLTDRPATETDDLIRKLGVDGVHRGAAPNRTAEFLASRRDAGKRVSLIGDCTRYHDAIAQAYVAISTGCEGSYGADTAAVHLLDGRLDHVVDLLAIARAHEERVKVAERFIVWPGLVCVAGAFFFGATALTAVFLSNLGTLGLYNRSVEGLQSLKPRSSPRQLPQKATA